MSSYDDIMNELGKSFGSCISLQLKTLLESKHLYQSVQVEHEDLIRNYPFPVNSTTSKKTFTEDFSQLVSDEWIPSDPAMRFLGFGGTGNLPPTIKFDMPHVKLFCQRCDRIEAFNVQSVQSFLEQGRLTTEPYKVNDQVVQVFVASFLCQSCKTVPEAFLVRRQGFKLILSGRSPIEHIEVPSVLPKPIQKYYSGAIVAHQSGQTLAGLFMLRTLIEQWVRQYLKEPEIRIDDANDRYMESLPVDFRSRFKSMRDLYSDISLDLHMAKGSPELFDSARKAIVEHFDARRLFGLRD